MKNITIPEKKLGFGLMRLPLKADGTIDQEVCNRMADRFIEEGFTYFDTAYKYHDGESEHVFRKAVAERYPRESYTVATKMPAWFIKEEGDAEKIFYEQLEKTGAGYFDYYLLHAVSLERLSIYDGFKCWDLCLDLKKKGLIKHFGFSFHDTAEALDKILTAHPEAEFVQLQLNYLDWDNEAVQARECYEVAVKHNMPVIVMEPVKGGTLAKFPESVESIFKEADKNASIPSWAIRFAATHENVFMVLSGMSDEAQMEDNIATMKDFKRLDSSEMATVEKAADEYKKLNTVPCTACRYCMDLCPQSIKIPDLIAAVNQVKVYGMGGKARKMYDEASADNAPDACIECGQCISVCPQHLEIPNILKEISSKFIKKDE